jgi:4-hydroxy-L-threonine phosphate dehydrogenase PdxA
MQVSGPEAPDIFEGNFHKYHFDVVLSCYHDERCPRLDLKMLIA